MSTDPVQRAIALLNGALENPVTNLTADTKLLELPGLDSLAMEKLAVAISEETGQEPSPMAFATVETVADLAKLLQP